MPCSACEKVRKTLPSPIAAKLREYEARIAGRRLRSKKGAPGVCIHGTPNGRRCARCMPEAG